MRGVAGSGCDYSWLAKRQRSSTTPAPPPCTQGVRGSSPLGSTASQRWFAPAWWLYFSGPYSRKYSNGHARISPNLAVRLEEAGVCTARAWLAMQSAHDLAVERAAGVPKVRKLDHVA
jgi:hypothetical protein